VVVNEDRGRWCELSEIEKCVFALMGLAVIPTY
jgi:hypothetical protein